MSQISGRQDLYIKPIADNTNGKKRCCEFIHVLYNGKSSGGIMKKDPYRHRDVYENWKKQEVFLPNSTQTSL